MIPEHPLTVVDETTSTNDVVRQWLEEGAPHGCALLAFRQTAGRGRHGRTWHTAGPRNLHLSIGLRHPRLHWHTGQLPIAVGVIVARTLDPKSTHDLGLKWPNDLCVGSRKIGGILCEGVARGPRIEAAVVGIGLNLLGDPSDLPEDLREEATTWAAVTGETPDLRSVAIALRTNLLKALDGFFDAPNPLREEWNHRDALRGVTVHALCGDVSVTGVARGIADDGALQLEGADGETTRIRSGEVKRVRPT